MLLLELLQQRQQQVLLLLLLQCVGYRGQSLKHCLLGK
jgi:hypothetical protein